MTTQYSLYVGARFEVTNGQPMNVYEIIAMTETHVTYTEIVSSFPRTVTIPTFIQFLTSAGARQV